MHPRSEQVHLGTLGLILALGIVGCSGGEAPTPTPPAQPAKPVAAKPVTPAPVPAPAPAVYAYETKGRRDPFRPLILPKKAEVVSRGRPKSDREALQVRELKLTGVVWEQSGASALVETPTGKGYVLRVNDRIGEDFGVRVAKITPEAVTFEVKPATAGQQAHVRLEELRLKKEE